MSFNDKRQLRHTNLTDFDRIYVSLRYSCFKKGSPTEAKAYATMLQGIMGSGSSPLLDIEVHGVSVRWREKP